MSCCTCACSCFSWFFKFHLSVLRKGLECQSRRQKHWKSQWAQSRMSWANHLKITLVWSQSCHWNALRWHMAKQKTLTLTRLTGFTKWPWHLTSWLCEVAGKPSKPLKVGETVAWACNERQIVATRNCSESLMSHGFSGYGLSLCCTRLTRRKTTMSPMTA